MFHIRTSFFPNFVIPIVLKSNFQNYKKSSHFFKPDYEKKNNFPTKQKAHFKINYITSWLLSRTMSINETAIFKQHKHKENSEEDFKLNRIYNTNLKLIVSVEIKL